jgi:hypothetical protein
MHFRFFSCASFFVCDIRYRHHCIISDIKFQVPLRMCVFSVLVGSQFLLLFCFPSLPANHVILAVLFLCIHSIMDSSPSSRDSEAVNLHAASSLSDVFFDAEEVLQTKSAVAAAAQESSSSIASSEDKSVTSSSNKSEMKKSSGGIELMSNYELEQHLWR